MSSYEQAALERGVRLRLMKLRSVKNMKYPKIEQRVVVTLTASIAGKHGETLEAIYHGRNSWEPVDQTHAWLGDTCVESWVPTTDFKSYVKILEMTGIRCVGHELKTDNFGRKQLHIHPHINDLHVAADGTIDTVIEELETISTRATYVAETNAIVVELEGPRDPLQKPDLSAMGPCGRSANRRAYALEAWGDALQARVQELEDKLKNRPVILASPYPM